MDDLPLVLHWLKQMEVATILDKWLMPAHQNRSGLSDGQLAVLFLAYVVSQADHRLNHGEAWVRAHQRMLELTTGWEIRDKMPVMTAWQNCSVQQYRQNSSYKEGILRVFVLTP